MTKEQVIEDLQFDLDKANEQLEYELAKENYENLSSIKERIKILQLCISSVDKIDGISTSRVNYTKPNDAEHEDNPEEWLNAALIYARGLSLLLGEGEGIVVYLHGDMENPYPETKSNKVIIFRQEEQMFIDSFEKDVEEGAIFKIIEPPNQN